MSESTITTAHREYCNRPPDERFADVPALIAHGEHEKQYSVERTYNLRDLQIVTAPTGISTGSDGKPYEQPTETLQLQSPKGQAEFTHWSFGQLCRTVGAPAAYLRTLPPVIAADALNYGLHDAAPVGTACNLLVKANGTEPVIRAATSDSYGRLWDADLYGNVARQIMSHDSRWTLPPTWDGRPAGAYAGDRDSFLIVVNGGSIVTDPSLASTRTITGPTPRTPDLRGDSHAAPADGMFRGLLIRNSEVGAASVTIETILFRYICGNHMLWGATMDRRFRRRHIGSHVLRDVVREISSLAYQFTQQSTERDNAIIRAMIDQEIAHTKEGVIDELRALGATKETAERAYDLAEMKESASPRSYWGITQGVTRASQEQEYQNERYELDQLASKILGRGAKLVAA
jgi:hypothetical protein